MNRNRFWQFVYLHRPHNIPSACKIGMSACGPNTKWMQRLASARNNTSLQYTYFTSDRRILEHSLRFYFKLHFDRVSGTYETFTGNVDDMCRTFINVTFAEQQLSLHTTSLIDDTKETITQSIKSSHSPTKHLIRFEQELASFSETAPFDVLIRLFVSKQAMMLDKPFLCVHNDLYAPFVVWFAKHHRTIIISYKNFLRYISYYYTVTSKDMNPCIRHPFDDEMYANVLDQKPMIYDMSYDQERDFTRWFAAKY